MRYGASVWKLQNLAGRKVIFLYIFGISLPFFWKKNKNNQEKTLLLCFYENSIVVTENSDLVPACR